MNVKNVGCQCFSILANRPRYIPQWEQNIPRVVQWRRSFKTHIHAKRRKFRRSCVLLINTISTNMSINYCSQVFKRLVTAVNDVEKRLPFSHHDRLGFLTFCPTNLGTTIRASVHIQLPKLAADKAKLEEIAGKYNLQVINTLKYYYYYCFFFILGKYSLHVIWLKCYIYYTYILLKFNLRLQFCSMF